MLIVVDYIFIIFCNAVQCVASCNIFFLCLAKP
uniref:Uncharacterized protein n=1 Tax=Arundo donax TaxID=35708 RepID=A0A0A8YTK6_ARUDO